jgi:hypothetical protein
MIRFVPLLARFKSGNPMTVITPSTHIELSWGSIYARIGRHEIYISRQYDQPRMYFDKYRSEDALELWGLGFYLVINPRTNLSHTAG